jgi:uncharacterized protein (TIGR02145 family)
MMCDIRVLFPRMAKAFGIEWQLLSAISLVLVVFSCNKSNPVNSNIESGTATDIDGNTYTSVKIGNQVWTVENLRTTRYNDGTAIPLVTQDAEWYYLVSPGYCFYNNTNNADSIRKFGALYNWYAVNTKKLAPAGWHVPTDSEWNTLVSYLLVHGYDWDSTTTENKLAKSLSATTDWETYGMAGTIGNDLTKNNRSGFSALPSGYRYAQGYSLNIGYFCGWWSATQLDSLSALFRFLNYDKVSFDGDNDAKNSGYSVRLIRDN